MSSAARTTAPLLAEGMRLSQPEFHRRYERYPDKTKFELIGGVVYMASPLYDDHGVGDSLINGVFFNYVARTPGVRVAHNVTVVLGASAEHQPDLTLRVLPEFGGQADLAPAGYIVGAPELICEVSYSSQRLDLGPRRDDYARHGVQEYVVYDCKANVVHWLLLPGGERLKPDRSGVFKSQFFPGLWLDGKALARGDSAALIATVEKGCKTAAHRKFVEKLRAARRA
jgi:Uma2 family endonuclease